MGGLDNFSVVPDALLLKYERRGHVTTRQLLPGKAVDTLRIEANKAVDTRELEALRQRVRVLCPSVDPQGIKSAEAAFQILADHGDDEVGFLQFFNLHRHSEAVRAIVTSPRLVATASQILGGVSKLRVYQDCLFLKKPGFGATNWHSDLRMAPLDTHKLVTAWIPLRDVSGEGDSGLIFAQGSHRDFALPFWYDLSAEPFDLASRGYPLGSVGRMAVGDVSWHDGWVLHAAPPQPPRSPVRAALAVSYFCDGAPTLARDHPAFRGDRGHAEDAESYAAWIDDVPHGAPARHELLPLVHAPPLSQAATRRR
ncbi:unnamed protein product [Pedinophyceae sp. YPF-701]|nr:unnamed protein product [Pedinophyceae sp. YPF-701]